MSIKLEDVNYIYGSGTAYEIHALKNINIQINDGEFIGIIGHTGSGKSTLIQHLDGLIKASSGDILYNGENIYGKDYKMTVLRQKVGLVFQYPEYQLFENTVLEDVCFGPKNLGLSDEESKKRAIEALNLTGVTQDLFEKSPFELSGGEKRRVAIAGVIAMKPEVLILDEPTAGLDPMGRDLILGQISRLHEEMGITVILVSHSMEDIAKYVSRLIVMNKGEVLYDETPREVFMHFKELEAIGLAAPQVTYLMHALNESGIAVQKDATTVDEAFEDIMKFLKKG